LWQQMAFAVLAPLPLLAAVLLVRRWLWAQGLGAYLRCCYCRLRQAVRAPVVLIEARRARHVRAGSSSMGGASGGSSCGGSGSSRGPSPQRSCDKAEMQQLLLADLAPAGHAGHAVPAWLLPAAAAGGLVAALVALACSTLLLTPRQVVGCCSMCHAVPCRAVLCLLGL